MLFYPSYLPGFTVYFAYCWPLFLCKLMLLSDKILQLKRYRKLANDFNQDLHFVDKTSFSHRIKEKKEKKESEFKLVFCLLCQATMPSLD